MFAPVFVLLLLFAHSWGGDYGVCCCFLGFLDIPNFSISLCEARLILYRTLALEGAKVLNVNGHCKVASISTSSYSLTKNWVELN